MQDSYGRKITYLRVSLTELCNLRCVYCMPPEGVKKRPREEMMTREETLLAIEAAAELGVTKLRFTGGEPLLKPGVTEICAAAASTPGIREVCLTTNGILLPAMAAPLRAAGVGRVNISLDTLDPEKYARISRVGQLSQALAGLDAALSAGFDRVKINTVLMGGVNDDEIPALAALTEKYPVDLRFIELMPMSGGALEPSAYLSCDTVLERLPALEPEESEGVARLYRLPGAMGRVGLISPLSHHFCASCDRLRLTADGRLKPCLHSPREISIRGLTKDEIKARILGAAGEKPEKHGELSPEAESQSGRSMNRIGG